MVNDPVLNPDSSQSESKLPVKKLVSVNFMERRLVIVGFYGSNKLMIYEINHENASIKLESRGNIDLASDFVDFTFHSFARLLTVLVSPDQSSHTLTFYQLHSDPTTGKDNFEATQLQPSERLMSILKDESFRNACLSRAQQDKDALTNQLRKKGDQFDNVSEYLARKEKRKLEIMESKKSKSIKSS